MQINDYFEARVYGVVSGISEVKRRDGRLYRVYGITVMDLAPGHARLSRQGGDLVEYRGVSRELGNQPKGLRDVPSE